MSWFDATGFASIAKSALKEAQRTIDKALDIREDSTHPSNTVVDTNTDDFFGSWGITESGHVNNPKPDTSEQVVTKSPVKSSKMTTSLWGSFTGSFFEHPKNIPSQSSVESLDDSVDLVDEGFSKSKLVVQQSDDGENNLFSRTISTDLDLFEDASPLDTSKKQDYCNTNRLSVISNESSKTSSDSLEIVSRGSSYTTSPDSDLQSTEKSTTPTSSMGLKLSESVEVLPDSLTSPSSVEILPTDTQNSDEFVSPLASPVDEKVSRSSIEVIPEEVDEDSISYASISESTSATLLEPSVVSTKPITKGPSRNNTHFSLIDTQPHSTKENILNIIENSNVIDIPQDHTLSESQVDDEGSQSDRTMIEGDTVMESSSDTSTTTETHTNSFYLKNMLADAMTEKTIMRTKTDNSSLPQFDIPLRENSPLSSESHSDLVKIESDQTSGHTSGDENETTTSSDIEIISSPNGDSSSTQSRHSPAKLTGIKQKATDANVDALLNKITFKKIKGHNRELSEASSISDDSHSSEVDRLIKRIADMTEILELREAKLIDFNRRNAELQEINTDLQHQLDILLTKQMESADITQVTEEYTQRLSALEKKIQQAIRDKDLLRKQLEQSKQEAATRMSKTELDSLIADKEEIIKELREEGEKLSKQQLQHSNIIKKLRAKEKEHENTIKNLKDNVEDVTTETERLKRSLLAKEEVERSQIEAVHNLTSKNKKLEHENSQFQSQLDDINQKYETVKKSLDAAKKELKDKNRTNTELHAREQMFQSLENEKQIMESQNTDIINQLEDLRFKLQQADQEYLRKESNLRQEKSELIGRLEVAERRNEELAQSIMEVSKPLVRQLEALQTTHNMKVSSFEKIEQNLLLKMSEIQSKLQVSTDAERVAREECLNMRSKLSSLESQFNTINQQNETSKIELEKNQAEQLMFEQELRREIDLLKEQLKNETEGKEKLQKDVTALEQQLSIEKAANEAEKRKNSILQEQIRDATYTKNSPCNTRNTSPTLSIGRVSMSESMGSFIWPTDEGLDINPIPRSANMMELQMLQSNLKQREGEVQQLQWELNRREQEKIYLNTEISKLLTRIENLESKCRDYDILKGQFEEVQQQYDTLCQLYGEKVEEAEELKLDLLDVKELYKNQLDELLNQQKGGGS